MKTTQGRHVRHQPKVKDLYEDIPWAVEFLPDVIIELSRGPVRNAAIVESVTNNSRAWPEQLENGEKARKYVTARVQAAIDYLLRFNLVEKDLETAALYLTDLGYDFGRELDEAALQTISKLIEPAIKVKKRQVWRRSQWQPAPDVLRALRERIATAKQCIPATHSFEARSVAMAGRIAATLPNMRLDQMYAIWANAKRDLSHSKQVIRLAAPLVIDAIEKERSRRGPEAVSRLPSGEFFRWPSTEAEKGNNRLDFEADELGVLAQAGYHVGTARGEPEVKRRRTLTQLFQDEIKGAGGEWGRPGSAGRLKKMAYTIAALARNGKRREAHMARAVAEWADDLEYLHDRYYVGRFDFPWPSLPRQGASPGLSAR